MTRGFIWGPRSARFYTTLVFLVMFVISLLVLALITTGFLANLALNLLTELIGALMIIAFLESFLQRAFRGLTAEEEARLDQMIQQFVAERSLVGITPEEIKEFRNHITREWMRRG